MKEKIFIDKNMVLDERVKELENSKQYVQFKITYSPLPDGILEDLYDKIEHNGQVVWSEYIEEVMDFVSNHVEYVPVVTITGKDMSTLDGAVLLSVAGISARKELVRILKEIGNLNIEGE